MPLGLRGNLRGRLGRLSLLHFLFLHFELGAKQLEDGQVRAVANAPSRVDDARISTWAAGKARSDIGKELASGLRSGKEGSGLAASVKAITLTESDKALDE